MKSKFKLKKMDKKTEEMFKASSVAVLLENLTDNIKIVAEGQIDLGRKIDRMEDRMDRMEVRMDRMEGRISNLEVEMKSGFSSITDRLDRIDDELIEIKKELKMTKEKKVDWSAYIILEKRMINAENDIIKLKNLLKSKKVSA